MARETTSTKHSKAFGYLAVLWLDAGKSYNGVSPAAHRDVEPVQRFEPVHQRNESRQASSQCCIARVIFELNAIPNQ